MQTHIFSILLQHLKEPEVHSTVFKMLTIVYLSQIHRKWFKDHAKMLLMEEVPMKANTVVFVVRIGVVDPPQDLKLLQPRLVHDLIVPDDLDADFLVGFHCVPGSDDI